MKTYISNTAVKWTFINLAVLLLNLASPVVGGTATLVDIATDATDPFNYADSEPSIAVNPKDPLQIAVVAFSGNWGDSVMAPVWKSNDGGTTWRKVFQISQPQPGRDGPGDQKIAFDAEGKLFIAELGIGSPPSNFIYRQAGSADRPLQVEQAYGDDQPHLEVDKSSKGNCFNRLFSPWLNFSNPGRKERSMVSQSITGGAVMTDVEAGDNSVFPNRTTRIALGSDGKAYIIYKTREGSIGDMFENAHFRVNRSDDCGLSWTGLGAAGVSVHGNDSVQTFFTTSFGNRTKGKVARARSSDAWIALDRNGTVYAAYVRKDNSGFGQIYVAQSRDSGKTWSSTRVTDGTHHTAYPEIAVADNGVVGVLFIDFDDSGKSTNFRHHFAMSNILNGAITSWKDEILQSVEPSNLDNAIDGFLWGDYEGLTAFGNTFYGVFTGESIGRAIRQLDPIFFKIAAD